MIEQRDDLTAALDQVLVTNPEALHRLVVVPHHVRAVPGLPQGQRFPQGREAAEPTPGTTSAGDDVARIADDEHEHGVGKQGMQKLERAVRRLLPVTNVLESPVCLPGEPAGTEQGLHHGSEHAGPLLGREPRHPCLPALTRVAAGKHVVQPPGMAEEIGIIDSAVERVGELVQDAGMLPPDERIGIGVQQSLQ